MTCQKGGDDLPAVAQGQSSHQRPQSSDCRLMRLGRYQACSTGIQVISRRTERAGLRSYLRADIIPDVEGVLQDMVEQVQSQQLALMQ